jgi:5,10-methylene-tetrahydrofolate dehydrogenase/methenyl tetrahydrofolate cyclohydrolase
MLANDGARVFSFDLDGVVEFNQKGKEVKSQIERKEALSISEIVITGVPNDNFDKIEYKEIKTDACCLNFSSFENFSSEVKEKVRIYIPRVGPVTVAMCLRNIARMAEFFKNK